MAARGHLEEAGSESGILRRMLLALVLFGILGLGSELLLLEHIDSVQQWIPLVVLGAGLASGLGLAIRPTPGTVRAFQVVMVLCVACGLLGVFLHYQGNVEWELERDRSAGGIALFWMALRGATPALAPGALVQLGLLGLILAYRHPALRRSALTRVRGP